MVQIVSDLQRMSQDCGKDGELPLFDCRWEDFMNAAFRLLLLLISTTALGCNRTQTVAPFGSERIELSYDHDGQRYYVVDDGNMYRQTDQPEAWELVTHVFDPEEMKQAYLVKEGKTYRVAPDTGQQYEVQLDIAESFEDLKTGLPGLFELVSEQRSRWGNFTLQSPDNPVVADYVAHRKALRAGTAGFTDARIEPSSELAHSGARSLKCVAPAKPASMITCKASLESPLVYFREGDDFWFEAYYFAQESLPLTLVDLECEFVAEHPGIRLRIFDDRSLGVELKALDKPVYRQPAENVVDFPKNQWVHVRLHFALSATEGRMEVWQDNKKVLDRTGITLPFRSAIYNSLEVGISAHSNPNQKCVLFVDDLRCSHSADFLINSQPEVAQ